MSDQTLRCERCFIPLTINRGKLIFQTYSDDLRNYFHDKEKILCDDCLAIADHASSSDSWISPITDVVIKKGGKLIYTDRKR
jgi:hypothetical protein